VLSAAEELGLKVYMAADKKELDSLFATTPVTSRLGVLIDFGIIVSADVIDYFPLGIVNSHFSLLPEWRGADPITFAILSGQEQTGVSLMLLVPAMDEGPLLAQGACPVDTKTTTPSLTEQLIRISNQLLGSNIPAYLSGDIAPEPQDNSKTPSYSRKLTKDDGVIDWTKPADRIEREVRAYIEWPKSRTTFSETEIIITEAHVVTENGQAGDTAIIDKLPVVFCGTGALAIDKLKPAGKKEITGQSFLAGYKKVFLG
jgi:methionyl-tRNA formyltransferase